MSEYRLTLRQAIWGFPMAAAFGLAQARASRNGAELPGFTDHAAGAARERVNAWFAENYHITRN